MENAWEYDIPIHQLLVDFREAYGSISREVLYNILEEVPQKLIKVIQIIMENTLNQVKIKNQLTKKSPTNKGLRQGDDLIPILFNLNLEKVIRDSGIKTTAPL